MSDKQETTDDIIREMRDLGALDAQCNDMIPRSLQALGLRTYAARLEAARKRETGNGAALREALKAMLDEYCDLCDVQNQMTESGHTCSWRNRWSGCQSKAIDKARTALTAPPRNCDRFNSGEEAWITFERERPDWCDEHSSKDPDCDDCEMADCGRCMAEWLFATEGGAE